MIRSRLKLKQHRWETPWRIIGTRTGDAERRTDRTKKKPMANGARRRGGSGGGWRIGERARHRAAPPPSIDNYSFRRVARRGQIPILKRRSAGERKRDRERERGGQARREVSRPEEIRNLGCRFAVRCRPSRPLSAEARSGRVATKAEGPGRWRGESGGLNVCTSGAPAER